MQMRVSNVQMFNENAFTIISNIASNILICHFRIPYAIRHRVQPQIRYIMSCPNLSCCCPCLWNICYRIVFCAAFAFEILFDYLASCWVAKRWWPVGRRSRLWLTTRRHLTSPPIICTCASLCLLQVPASPLAVCNSICCTAGDYLHWPGRWQTQNADFNCDHSHYCCSF